MSMTLAIPWNTCCNFVSCDLLSVMVMWSDDGDDDSDDADGGGDGGVMVVWWC